jgi:hypothetical protein
VDERATKLSESVLEEADRNGVLRWKEELDAKHLQSSLTDGCVCGLCKAARTALAESPSEPPAVLTSELESLKAMPDAAIDTSDIPEVTDWSKAERGKFYRKPLPERDTRTREELLEEIEALRVKGASDAKAADSYCNDFDSACREIKRLEAQIEALRAGEPQRGKG